MRLETGIIDVLQRTTWERYLATNGLSEQCRSIFANIRKVNLVISYTWDTTYTIISTEYGGEKIRSRICTTTFTLKVELSCFHYGSLKEFYISFFDQLSYRANSGIFEISISRIINRHNLNTYMNCFRV